MEVPNYEQLGKPGLLLKKLGGHVTKRAGTLLGTVDGTAGRFCLLVLLCLAVCVGARPDWGAACDGSCSAPADSDDCGLCCKNNNECQNCCGANFKKGTPAYNYCHSCCSVMPEIDLQVGEPTPAQGDF